MRIPKGWETVVMASVFAVVVIGAAGATYFFENKGTFPFLSAVTPDNPNDEDGDGLLTWEELVWHTDPLKADTDGDGASDGAEVSAGSNPAIPGAGENPYETWGGFSPSEVFARDALAAQVAYDEVSGTPEASKALAKEVADKVQIPDFRENIPYSALKISTTTDIRAYAELTVRVLQNSLKARTDELAIFKRTIDSRNFLGTPELKTVTSLYKSIEAGLLAIPVPAEIAEAHLTLVNSVGTLANVTGAMGAWGGDPVAGLAYMDAFLKAEASVQTDMTNLFTVISNLLNK